MHADESGGAHERGASDAEADPAVSGAAVSAAEEAQTDAEEADDPTVSAAAVLERLDRVYDPELDRSVVELEYVTDLTIDAGRVSVTFVLPTAWCSPAFAWMMATGIRDEVGELSGVDDVAVELVDHMHAAEINRGVNEALAFEDAFYDADDDVADVRGILNEKVRMARQFQAFEALADAGLSPDQIVGLTPADLERNGDRIVVYVRDGSVGITVPADPIATYLEKARSVGLAREPDEPVFANLDGEPIEPEAFESVRLDARVAWSNVSGQASICAHLHEARNGVKLEGV